MIIYEYKNNNIFIFNIVVMLSYIDSEIKIVCVSFIIKYICIIFNNSFIEISMAKMYYAFYTDIIYLVSYDANN